LFSDSESRRKKEEAMKFDCKIKTIRKCREGKLKIATNILAEGVREE